MFEKLTVCRLRMASVCARPSAHPRNGNREARDGVRHERMHERLDNPNNLLNCSWWKASKENPLNCVLRRAERCRCHRVRRECHGGTENVETKERKRGIGVGDFDFWGR
jgi:hypothetical protein